MATTECSDCSRAACCYEKDSSPRRYYCGRHGAQWTRRGIHIIQDPRLATARKAPELAPIYDDVFARGAAYLDSLATGGRSGERALTERCAGPYGGRRLP